MAATIISKASVTLLFGVGAGIAAMTGFVATGDKQDLTSKTAEAYDSQGSTLAKAYFDQQQEIKVEALILSGTAVPIPGATVTLASSLLESGSTLYVVEGPVSADEKNNGFSTISIPLRRFVDNSIPNA